MRRRTKHGERNMGATITIATLSVASLISGASDSPARASISPEQRAGVVRSYQIPAGSMSKALNAVAGQNGLLLLYDAALTESLRTPGLSGHYSAQEALDRLLAGTRLSYRFSADGETVSILLAQADNGVRNDADGAEALPPIDVGAQARRPANGASDGGAAARSYTVTHASTATKTDTPLMETPFTVQVMPRQVLKDMGQQQNLGDAMRLLGIASAGFDSYSSTFYYRGFTSSATLWNGFRIEELTPTSGPGAGPVWMDNVDRLELMRGPASILNGQLEPGGMVNVITRKPLEQFHAEARVGFGSWSNRWESLDVGGPLNDSKTLLGRVIVSDQYADSYFTHSPPYKSQGVAPQLEWRITPQTTLAFEGQYRQVEAETWPYSWSFVNPANGLTYSASRRDSRLPSNVGRWEQSRSMFSLAHRFDEDWSVSWKFLHDDTNQPFADFQFLRNADFSTLAPGVLNVGGYLLHHTNRLETQASTLDVLGHFTTWGVEHTLLAGGDVYAQDFTYGAGFDTSFRTNIFNPTAARYTATNPASDTVRDRLKHSLYVQDQVELPFGVHVLAGLRYQHSREDYARGGVASTTYRKDVWTPRFGVLWRPQPWLSGYYSYSENQGQSPGFEYPGTPIKPEFSRQHEAGIKTELLDGRLNATAAVFELTKENIATADTLHPTFVIGVGKVRSTGYEFNVQGALTDDWNVLANYSYARPLVLVGSSGGSGLGYSASTPQAGQLLPDVPLHNFSIWTSYRLPWLPGLKLGGGASWRSQATAGSASYNLVTGQFVSAEAYWLASAFVSYETRLAGYDARLQVNIDNLFDTAYSISSSCYGGVGRSSCADFFGSPRSARVELRVAF